MRENYYRLREIIDVCTRLVVGHAGADNRRAVPKTSYPNTRKRVSDPPRRSNVWITTCFRWSYCPQDLTVLSHSNERHAETRGYETSCTTGTRACKKTRFTVIRPCLLETRNGPARISQQPLRVDSDEISVANVNVSSTTRGTNGRNSLPTTTFLTAHKSETPFLFNDGFSAPVG